mgnify:CR=1 FL=1
MSDDRADYPAFAEEQGAHWQYPINYAVRDYQFNIVQRALFSNTLVSLPTGLGKTFIAAVIMFNYYRWFPTGKVVFMAPTRPLVLQQVDACRKATGIPQSDTAAMTGSIAAEQRALLWKSRSVFFLTPQTLQNDLLTGICPARSITCLVIDEAHRYAALCVLEPRANFTAERKETTRIARSCAFCLSAGVAFAFWPFLRRQATITKRCRR